MARIRDDLDECASTLDPGMDSTASCSMGQRFPRYGYILHADPVAYMDRGSGRLVCLSIDSRGRRMRCGGYLYILV